jgi:TIR domain/Pentapeptide repeats (8 copies)
MPNDEHLALLLRGTATWNTWRDRNPDTRPDLSRADLHEADLQCADLHEADLQSANLNGANLDGADLHGANLQHAHLLRASLADANLTSANLNDAELPLANLRDANLSGVTLFHADLRSAGLIRTNFTNAFLYDTNLSQALIAGSIFKKTKFEETILARTYFKHAIGLDDCVHFAPSIIDFQTLVRSKDLPVPFLRGCGLPDALIDYLPSLRGEAIKLYSCFISYSAKDQMFADRLHADLQNKGVRCWFAPHDLPIGAKTWDAIDEAIRLREKLLVILSKASLGSDWVEDEVTKAFAEERSRKETVLLPIRIDNTVMTTREAWAVKLRDQRNIGDFRQWKKPAEYQKSLDRLLRDLRTISAEQG